MRPAPSRGTLAGHDHCWTDRDRCTANQQGPFRHHSQTPDYAETTGPVSVGRTAVFAAAALCRPVGGETKTPAVAAGSSQDMPACLRLWACLGRTSENENAGVEMGATSWWFDSYGLRNTPLLLPCRISASLRVVEWHLVNVGVDVENVAAGYAEGVGWGGGMGAWTYENGHQWAVTDGFVASISEDLPKSLFVSCD